MRMWYEIIPTFAIITGISWLPFQINTRWHDFWYGSPWNRVMYDFRSYGMYIRDRDGKHGYPSWLTKRSFTEGVAEGNPSNTFGLEKVKDD